MANRRVSHKKRVAIQAATRQLEEQDALAFIFEAVKADHSLAVRVLSAIESAPQRCQ
jgi:hypothetical protein